MLRTFHDRRRESLRRDICDTVANEYALQVQRGTTLLLSNLVLVVDVTCEGWEVATLHHTKRNTPRNQFGLSGERNGKDAYAVRLTREVQRSPSKLGEGFEKDSDEGVNVDGGVLGGLDSLAEISVGETNPYP